LRRRLSEQGGFAVVITIGVSAVLGIVGTTSMIYTVSNEGSSARSKADRRALSLAEAALNNAYATIHNAADPTLPGAVPERSEPLEGGTATWSGSLDTATNVWTLTGTGRVANPVRGADVIRTVRGRVRLGTASVGSGGNAIWNYIYAEAPTSCMSIGNSVNVSVPLYVAGDLCMTNSSQLSGAATVLQVGGTLTITNSAHVGQSGSPILRAHIGEGCRLDGGPLHDPCSSADAVYATQIDSQPTGLTKPPVDLAGWYENAKPGPKQACTTAIGAVPAFDNDTTMNRSLTQPVNLTPSVPYTCIVLDAAGGVLGQLIWNPATKSLLIAGTIFFDGDIEFTNGAEAFYVGRATIYASGKITLRNSAKVCGVSGCNATWNPLANLLAFVAGSSTDATGFRIENSGVFQGAIYVVNDYNEENSATVWGPIIARQVHLQNSASNFYVPLGTLLSGMPSSSTEAVTLTNESGSWY
jgi:Tfp pilus assembly protein PilX